ncbi:MAG TPA: ShlB/FhaC/HecB family hemolysin secretion/activation protein [Sphingomonas sp.]|nr:ShlB/FhaC/HecB family hemolysin secretion/activation protein [Sphingomonas sp.]
MLKSVCATLVALGPAAALAQPVPGSPTGLLIDQGRIDRAQPAAPTAATPPAKIQDHVTSVDAQASDHGTLIRGVAFDGTQVPERVADAARPFLGKPASGEVLTALANAMSAAYGKSAVALYTVAIPAQRFVDGVVHVSVTEGFVEQVIITGDVKHSSLRLVQRYAARLTSEHPLRRATLQRYLSLIRDIPGLTLDVKLLKGDRPGGVKLMLVLKQKGHDVAVSYDSRTQEGLAQGAFQATGKLFGALRPGDETDLILSASANFRNYGYAGLTHSTPIGTGGTRASVSIAHLATKARGTDIKGSADVLSFSISHPLIRSYQRNLVLSTSLDGVNSDNAVLGSLLSREHSRAVRGTAIFSDVAGKHALSGTITVSHGLDIFHQDTVMTLADPRFTKVDGRISLSRAVGKKFVVRLATAGQWSRDPLPAVERFVVGGADFGRAFPVAILSSDRGVAGSAELGWRPIKRASFAASELYVFGDIAKAHYVERGLSPAASYDLASAGFGVRFAYREKAHLDIEAAKRVDVPFPGYSKGWQVNVAWRLSLGR